MIKIDFLDNLAKFSLVIRKRVTSSYVGQRKSNAVGRGILFRDHRIYAPGDDFRAIDWKVYARTDDLYIKNYEEDRNLTLHCIVDASMSMKFGKPDSKFDYASMISVGFAYLSIKENEKFQFSSFSDDVDVFQPRRGMSHLASMVHYLNTVKLKGKSKMYECMTKYNKTIGSKAMVILISDFMMPIEEIRETIYLLSRHHLKIVQVLDPKEKKLSFDGDYKFQDLEDDGELRTYVTPGMRLKYQKLMDSHNRKIEELCDKLGIEFYQFTTDTPVFKAFYEMIG